ncbi:YfaZ domain containing protein [Asbolus verrucosus]|uniref:YfaZ domain containing protein n=1 Tax=Asbolus verrucosus TaxID=1661398 RepID=A0A482VWT7_ASBVE|nr:YfaZ domain containing protein [Asbolus verrucosus]
MDGKDRLEWSLQIEYFVAFCVREVLKSIFMSLFFQAVNFVFYQKQSLGHRGDFRIKDRNWSQFENTQFSQKHENADTTYGESQLRFVPTHKQSAKGNDSATHAGLESNSLALGGVLQWLVNCAFGVSSFGAVVEINFELSQIVPFGRNGTPQQDVNTRYLTFNPLKLPVGYTYVNFEQQKTTRKEALEFSSHVCV